MASQLFGNTPAIKVAWVETTEEVWILPPAPLFSSPSLIVSQTSFYSGSKHENHLRYIYEIRQDCVG